MPKQSSKSKVWVVVLIILLLGLAIWASVMLLKRENTDYRSPETYIGLSETQAVDRAEAGNLEHRVVERNGEQFPVTQDFNPDRINFTVNSDEVTKAEFY